MKAFLAMTVAILFFTGCGREEIELLTEQNAGLKSEAQGLKIALEKAKPAEARMGELAEKLKGISARIFTNYGEIAVAFKPDKAPLHCLMFITRAECGYYNNTQFHRVIKGFMIQGGDPHSKDKDPFNDGSGGPLVQIPHEFNEVHHGRGLLSMARVGSTEYGAGSQFFIMHGDNASLDRQYTVFGEVTQGMDVVDKIAEAPVEKKDSRRMDHPIQPVIIQRIDVFR
ncbi:MAG: peptidylprolyl isomerase [Fibrobacterota bacterium]